MNVKFKYTISDAIYEATEGSQPNLVTVTNLRTGIAYKDYYTNQNFRRKLESGALKEVKDDSLTLKIDVKSSQLDKALATAKELEATLLRIKGLLSCSGS